jgi:N-acetylglucosaminyldiphosphoundecaprenol N-acetyl-beta-D-mannosaminyltransferase
MRAGIARPERVTIAGVDIDRYTFDESVDVILNHVLSNGSPEYVVTPNAQHIVDLQRDAEFQRIYRKAFLVVPDGVPLLWAAKFLQDPLRGRVNGTDLFERLAEVAAQHRLKVFLMGGRPGAADRAATVLQNRHPGLQITGTYCPPFGFEKDPAELQRISDAVRDAAPDILFVGLGAPKQEKWIEQNYQALGVPVSLGIGVSFEFVAGMVQRAPKFMQKTGLEWFFRLLMEPRRLWKRYVVGNTVFLLMVLKQRFS